MLYLSLARKYRPQNFDEIIGQEHIATTLKNAIAMDRVAHAYLFAGPRGVGKTSTARILAKSLNCEKGPTAKPCNKCTSCREISQGISMDVIEIDGASNRGIDEIRNLRENIKFASIHGKFRIYIIDEVHMLTQEAFNALLKTLEEPPLHVKFIFATTRPYKVLPTVLSRCQRFDFRKISTQDIAKKLEAIKEEEKFDINNEAMFLIAKQADGSVRDAETILDQLLSFTKGKINADDVTKVLGILEQDVLFDLANAIINSEKGKILKIINDLVNSGKDPIFITSGIIDYFRNVMVVKLARDEGKILADLSDEDYGRLQEQSRKFSLDEILYITYTLSSAIELIRKTSLGKIPLEISLIKLSERPRLVSIKEVLNKLALIEERLKGEPLSRGFEEKLEKITEAPEPLPIPEAEVAAERDILLLQKIKDSWPKILNFIKNKKMSVATFLAEGTLLKVKDNVLSIGFGKDSSLHKEALEANTNKKFVEEAIKNTTGENISLEFETMEAEAGGGAALEEAEVAIDANETPNANEIEPIVESAIDIFEGRIMDIKESKQKE